VPLVETEGGPIVTLTLNRPEARNALSIEMCDSIVDGLASLETRSDVRVVILRGRGNVFCSGADLAAVSGPGAASFLAAFERMLEAVAHHPVPTIACVQGAALGGGLQLATVCDFRIGAHDAKIGIPSTRLGIVVNFENVERLVLLAGIAVAKEVLMTARVFSGVEAERAGLLTRCASEGELDSVTNELAERIARAAPLSVRGAKRAIEVVVDRLGAGRSRDPDAVAGVDDLVAEAYASADLQEGLRAMGEKRAPRFTGR
jgi:enoyl-CoA hydratase/carnithine racemase